MATPLNLTEFNCWNRFNARGVVCFSRCANVLTGIIWFAGPRT